MDLVAGDHGLFWSAITGSDRWKPFGKHIATAEVRAVDDSESETHQKCPSSKEKKLPPLPSRRSRYTTRFRRWWSRAWWWPHELLNWLLATSFLGALVALLCYYQGRPVPQMKFDVTINTLVAIFSTLTTFALAAIVASAIGQLKWLHMRETRRLTDFQSIDEASKGPFGSLVLLFTGRGGLRAVVGSILMLAIVALGPVAQRLVQYPQTTAIAGVATIPVATAFSAMHTVDDSPQLSVSAIMAITNAFYASPVDPPTDCQTGNCSWSQPYTTLGLCSSCTDISHLLTPYLFNDTASNSTVPIGVQLPNGFILQYIDDSYALEDDPPWQYNMNVTAWASEDIWNVSHASPQASYSIAYENMIGKFHDMFVIVGSFDNQSTTGSGIMTPVAYECVLQWCLQQYTGMSVAGDLKETVVAVIDNTTVSFGDPQTNCYTIEDLSRQLTDPATGQIYNVSGLSEEFMQDELYEQLNGTWMSGSTTSFGPLPVLWNAMTGSSSSPNQLYQQVAQSLSNFMRTGHDDIEAANITTSNGLATTYVTVVQVKWAVLTYPLMVLVLSGAYVVAIMLESRREMVSGWKTNGLASLFHGVDAETTQELGLLLHVDEMEDAAMKTTVSLGVTGDHFRLAKRHDTQSTIG